MRSTYRNKKWLAAVGQIEQCVLCGAWGVQVAHRNEGKGIGMKTDDCATAAICVTCHSEIDNGKGLSRDERRQLMDRAIVLTPDRPSWPGGARMNIYDITPVSKPRMTQQDRWHKRPATAAYWAFKAEVRLLGINIPESGYHITFIIPMPKSWSQKKRTQLNGQAHQQKPDKDNLEKALLDAIFDDDSRVWDGRVTKLWGEKGQIIIGECAP